MDGTVKLSRREREIMGVLFARGGATVNEVREDLPDPPTPMAVRRLLAILMEKGHVRRKKGAPDYVYLPRAAKAKSGVRAFRDVVKTFFDGALDTALATHLESPGASLDDETLDRIGKLIAEHRERNSTSAKKGKKR